jgi:ferredoxin--NADP+ reductase
MQADGSKYSVAVIGAGPAGLYAAKELADNGVRVVLINRDVKPGGLAEYGIYPNKYKMKSGLRRQFEGILESPLIEYLGNVTVGLEADIALEDLQAMGFDAILVTVGAQGTKWLGLPGEELDGVFHAKDLVYHYNRLPPFSEEHFDIGKRVAIIGVGNVMMDIAHWVTRELKVDEVVAVARRGPAEVKFTKKEMQALAKNLDLGALDAEIARCAGVMAAVGQDPEAAKRFILAGLDKADEPVSDTRFMFQFLSSPHRIVGDENGKVAGLEVEDTTLVPRGEDTKARGLGTFRVLPVDTVVFAIGDRVDEDFGLPVEWNEFVKTESPVYPVDDSCYESTVEGVFVAGWSRKASDGLVGVARKDGTNGARAVLAYLEACHSAEGDKPDASDVLARLKGTVVRKADLVRLVTAELAEAEVRGLPEYKFATNEEMLAVMREEPLVAN